MEYAISKDELVVLLEFLNESEEHLDGIEEKVLKLEASKDVDLINSIFRPIHTIKGTSSFLNLANVGHFAHEVETLLDDLRKGRIQEIDEDLIDVILASIDTISHMLQAVREAVANLDVSSGKGETQIMDVPYQEVMERVIAMRGRATGGAAGAEPPAASKSPVSDGAKQPSGTAFPQQMKEQFQQEGDDHLSVMEEVLLHLEQSPDQVDLLNDLFRALHSLKGNTGVILSLVEDEGERKKHHLNTFRDIAHLAESLVQSHRDSRTPLGAIIIDLLFRCKDALSDHLDHFKKGDVPTLVWESLVVELSQMSRANDALTREEKRDGTEGGIKEIGGDSLALAVSNTLEQSLAAIEAGLREIGEEDKRQKAIGKMRRGYEMLDRIGQKIQHPLLADKAKAGMALIQFLSMGKDPNEEMFLDDMRKDLALLRDKGDRRKKELPDRRKATLPPPPSSSLDAAASSAGTGSRSGAGAPALQTGGVGEKVIKVSQEKIDGFMNLIGELLVSKNNLHMLARSMAMTSENQDMVNRLKEAAEGIARISDQLQSTIMEIRMLPIANAFSKFPRMIRDLSKKLGKKIRLEISGEETEIDKNIIEALSDPLVHMIRNSADHGIEDPDARQEAGKSEEGLVALKAYNQGQHVVIEIVDDGRGIDPSRVRQKVLEKGLLNELELEKMDDAAVTQLIFLPGFSMAKEVTDVSGRGVGMDVVKTNIERLGGNVTIDSRLGQGTTFFIRLPLTMAIGRGLEVEAARNRYYIPLEYIVETLKVEPSAFSQYKDTEITVIRNEIVPVFRLTERLGLKREPSAEGEEAAKNRALPTVIVNVKNQKMGLIVDQYFNEGEYVIKPLSGPIADIEGISGAMITGEGRIHLILDLIKLF